MKKIKASTLRALVAAAVVIVVAVGYFTAIGIGNLSGFGIDAYSLLCPLGYLESLLASKVFVPRALISFIAIVLLVLLLGRVFCAWICPMPFLQKLFPGFKGFGKKDAMKDGGASGSAGSVASGTVAAATMDAAAETDAAAATGAADTMGALPPEADAAGAATAAADAAVESDAAVGAVAKPNTFKLDSRFGVLIGALGSAAIFGFPVFCLVCPVGLTFAIVYAVMRLFAFGEATWTVVLLPAILLVEVVFFRKWCSKVCPLGALMSLISGANKTLRPTIDNGKCLKSSQGANCLACAKSCPEHINIREPEKSATSLNNCTKCRECSDHCPAAAISFPFFAKKAERLEEKQVR